MEGILNTMNIWNQFKRYICIQLAACVCLLGGAFRSLPAAAQVVTVGAGSYTTALPAGASAPATPIYNTVGGPIDTHKFWTAKNWYPTNIVTGNGGPYNMIAHPLSFETTPSGLQLGFVPTITQYGNPASAFFQTNEADMTLGVAGLNASSVPVSANTDWSVDFNFGPITTRVGRGMPFVYALTSGSNPTLTFSTAPTVFANNGNILGITVATNSYGLFCPTGGSWSGIGSTILTCNLPSGHNYFSLALLPNQAALSTYATYAFSFPVNTQVSWNYNQSTSQVTTTYTVTTQAKEGTQNGFIMALYPHQYTALQGSSINTSYVYPSSTGPMEVLIGSSFTTVNTYTGVLPFLPPTGNYNSTTMQNYLHTVATEGNSYTGGDTYNMGKQVARIAHLLPIAGAVNDTADLNSMQTSLANAMQNWFNGAAKGQSSNVFYYDQAWGTLIGYPAGYGSDTSLNDHHFHYGYWIHASALLGLYNPSWLQTSNWGGMVNLLGRDIATPVRGDSMFPFLRHFDVYAGHSWASGQAPFGDGANEESSSEAVNAWTGLILYATETGNTQLRDAAIWMYTMETNSVFDYWFNDGPVATFPSGFPRVEIANIFDDKGDTGTWFSGAIEMEHGIEFLPINGGSLYLGRDPAYVQKNLNEIESFDPNVFSSSNTNWPDIIEEYQAFTNPSAAISEWNNTSFVFDGETKAHEYYWLENMQALGQVDENITANTPLYAVFNNGGIITHVAYNTTTSPMNVTFSDGTVFTIPAGTLMSEKGTLTTGPGTTSGSGGSSCTSVPSAPTGLAASGTSSSGTTLNWAADNAPANCSISSYTVLKNGASIGTATGTSLAVTGLSASTTYSFTVEATDAAGTSSASSAVSVTTSASGGGEGPFGGTPAAIAGTVMAENYDTGGQGIGYNVTAVNGSNNGYRTDGVDLEAASSPATGNDVGWSAAGQWFRYTVNVATAGTYKVSFLVADGSGGAVTDAFHLSNSAGTNLSGSVAVPNTGGWQTWTTVTANVTLPAGVQTLTLNQDAGGWNIDSMAFAAQVASCTSAPSAPTGLAASGTSSSGTNLTWTADTAPANCSISSYTVLKNGASVGTATGTSFAVTGLTASTTYSFTVEASDAAGTSPASSVLTVTTPASSNGGPNVNGIYTDGTSFTTGGLDNNGYAYSSSQLGTSLTWSGSTFTFGAANAADVYSSETIPLPAGQYSTLKLLATGVNGNQASQTFTVTYTDGTTTTIAQSLSDWFTPQSYAGESTAKTMTYRDTSTGGTSTGSPNLYGYSFAINSAKTVQSLTLPSNRNVVVLAYALVAPTSGGGTVAIDAGGGAAGSYIADADFSGGNTASTTATINTANVPTAAPQAVYQSERWGPSTYTIPGLTAGKQYTVSLQFAEIYWTAVGQRQFNVIINGNQVLTNFDIIAATGGPDIAIQENFSATANSSGQIVIQFTNGAADQAKISGIEVQ